jgi:hypothetical protein
MEELLVPVPYVDDYGKLPLSSHLDQQATKAPSVLVTEAVQHQPPFLFLQNVGQARRVVVVCHCRQT